MSEVRATIARRTAPQEPELDDEAAAAADKERRGAWMLAGCVLAALAGGFMCCVAFH